MRDFQKIIFNSAVTNVTASSAAIAIQQNFKLSAMVIATDPGTDINGTFQLEVSNDQAPAGEMAPYTPTNWAPLGSSITINDAGTDLITATDICYRWLRGTYTDASGGASTGLLTVIVEMQGV